ncbi:MAG: putative toxin-antitoxin system toxin component, PIN family [Gemmataceae bacterium]
MPAVVVGATVLTELRRVLRQKLRVPADTVEEMDALLRRHAVVVNNAPALALKLRDKSDVPVLAEAIAGGADVLVTGERDLLNIADKTLLPILTPRGFWEWLRAAPASDE